MKESWSEALAFTFQWEGGYSGDSNDPGNWTGGAVGSGIMIGSNRGISAPVWKEANPGQGDSWLTTTMQTLTPSDAEAIYKNKYWNPIQGDSLSAGLDLLVFDEAVNVGVSGAVKIFQGVLMVVQDGVIGPQTMGAVASFDPSVLIAKLAMAQINDYLSFGDWYLYGIGWTRRCAARTLAALELLAS